MMTKKIAVHGVYEAKVPVTQRYWKLRKDGVKQRYWRMTRRMKKVEGKGRYELHGKSKDLYKTVVLGHHFMPKGFVDVSAKDFLERPEEYGFAGEWVEREVES